MTGFTGSGTAVITMTELLWIDGRYFVRPAVRGSITLYKSGEEGVPTIEGS